MLFASCKLTVGLSVCIWCALLSCVVFGRARNAESKNNARELLVTGSIRGNQGTPAPGGVCVLGAHETVLSKELPDLLPVRGRDTGAQLPEGHAEVKMVLSREGLCASGSV